MTITRMILSSHTLSIEGSQCAGLVLCMRDLVMQNSDAALFPMERYSKSSWKIHIMKSYTWISNFFHTKINVSSFFSAMNNSVYFHAF